MLDELRMRTQMHYHNVIIIYPPPFPYKAVMGHAVASSFCSYSVERNYKWFIVKMSQPGSQNVPSNLLSHEENDLIFTLVGQRKQVRKK